LNIAFALQRFLETFSFRLGLLAGGAVAQDADVFSIQRTSLELRAGSQGTSQSAFWKQSANGLQIQDVRDLKDCSAFCHTIAPEVQVADTLPQGVVAAGMELAAASIIRGAYSGRRMHGVWCGIGLGVFMFAFWAQLTVIGVVLSLRGGSDTVKMVLCTIFSAALALGSCLLIACSAYSWSVSRYLDGVVRSACNRLRAGPGMGVDAWQITQDLSIALYECRAALTLMACERNSGETE
jgi:hypothetical protein